MSDALKCSRRHLVTESLLTSFAAIQGRQGAKGGIGDAYVISVRPVGRKKMIGNYIDVCTSFSKTNLNQ